MTSAPVRWVDTPQTTGVLPAFRVGDVTVHPLRELDYLPLPEEFFPQTAAQPWDPDAWYAREPHVTGGRLRLNQQAHLLATPSGWVLVDTGGGNGKDRRNPAFHQQRRPWLEQLGLLGIGPQDIDLVVLTHVHVDHVGFATRPDGAGGWAPTFPRARYVLARDEYAFWTGPQARPLLERTGDYVADSVVPLHEAGVLDLVTGPVDVTPEIRVVPAPGHTPGNTYLEVRSAGERALFVGDMLHHAVQLARPAWSTRYCVSDADAAAQRLAVLDEVADTPTLLVAAHLPFPTAGRVRREGDGFRIELVALEQDGGGA